ncbi:MAG TPA: ATP-binding cassette domain-containing protein [Solirubrobacteraceae bacterium]|jgi:energy-coupling factor transport system ATP-binding protein|nr:ATP-binding cassette domain-containing protein [Solirubrobacteraceae bacterium]
MSVLQLENVLYSYPGAVEPSLREVSLSLEPGEFCVLAGRSGSGKSTLLRAAAGLVPHFHGGSFSGRVTVAGLDTRDSTPAQIGAVAGTLLQDPESQVVMSTVRSELALAVENLGRGAGAVARAVEEVALALGIAELLDRPTAELSGGELQRVALAAALVSRPALVLLDEPTSQLDPVAGDELIWQLRRLNQESDTAVLLIEHRLERCLGAADRVIAMSGGRVACDSDPGGFLEWAAREEPSMRTPAARLIDGAGLAPPPAGVKQARATLRRNGMLPTPGGTGSEHSGKPGRAARRPWLRRREKSSPALAVKGVWHELRDGPAILRGVDLRLEAGETVALMGRNGAGKSTLLRHAAGLLDPTRGSVARAGRLALLLQNPGDYLLHERVAEETSAESLELLGLTALAERHPRDLSGGERQRLALAIVLAGEQPAATIALDEPTRGMDRHAKEELAAWLRGRAVTGTAVLVATHDAEFAATLADRVVLLADGRVIADGPIEEILAGGWYFATETARILGGAGGALLPEQGVELLLGGPRPVAANERVGAGR